jgi:hypothetical protein
LGAEQQETFEKIKEYLSKPPVHQGEEFLSKYILLPKRRLSGLF